MKFSIVIPCYNERKNIAILLQRIIPLQKKYDLEYILVENGSLDNTSEYFKRKVDNKFSNISIVYIKKNLGYGYGVQQGLKKARGDYVGWIHADLQVSPDELIVFFEYILKNEEKKGLFLKGQRTNRSRFDKFFTFGQSLFCTILFRKRLYDVGAIPVLFNKELIKDKIDSMPNDFSIETYIYLYAILEKYEIRRFKVKLEKRKDGKSSWNHGLMSKIRQSQHIFEDCLLIKRGEKVL